MCSCVFQNKKIVLGVGLGDKGAGGKGGGGAWAGCILPAMFIVHCLFQILCASNLGIMQLRCGKKFAESITGIWTGWMMVRKNRKGKGRGGGNGRGGGKGMALPDVHCLLYFIVIDNFHIFRRKSCAFWKVGLVWI